MRKRLRGIIIVQAVVFAIFFLASLTIQVVQSYRNHQQNNYQTAVLMAQDTVKAIKTSLEITKFPITPAYNNQVSIFDTLKRGNASRNLRYCQELSEILRTYINQNRYIEAICIYEMNGSGVYVKADQASYYFAQLSADAPWVQHTLASKGEHVFVQKENFIGSGQPNPSGDLFCIARPIINGLTMTEIGIITVTIPEPSFSDSFEAAKKYPEQQYALMYQNNWLMGDFSEGLEPETISNLGARQQLTRNIWLDGSLYMYNYYRHDKDWTIAVRTPIRVLTQSLFSISIPFFIAIAILLLMIVLIIRYMMGTILHPLNELFQACDSMVDFSFPTVQETNLPTELKRLFSSFNAMSSRINILVNEGLVKDLSKREVELQMLRNQINPHFLYNTLEYIHMRAYSNGDYDVSNMAELLGNNLRYGLRGTDSEVELITELEHAGEYVQLISHHFSGKISYVYHVSEDIMRCMVIKLILQPVIENSFMHGMQSDKPLHIEIMGCRVGNDIELTISDDGIGMPPHRLDELRHSLNAGQSAGSIGLCNVSRRLQLYYGEQYGVEINSVEGKGTVSTIRMPFERGRDHGLPNADR